MDLNLNFPLHDKQLLALESPATELLYGGAAGPGKALGINTPILTTRGWKSLEDVHPGDWIYHPSGRAILVVAESEIMLSRPCCEVKFIGGHKLIADAAHLWRTFNRKEMGAYRRRDDNFRTRRREKRPPKGTIRTTAQIVNTQVPVSSSIRGHDTKLLIPPYTLGAWLGDGHSNGTGFTSADKFIVDRIRADGFEVRKWTSKYAYGICGLKVALRAYGLIENKHIPAEYFTCAEEQRRELLAGLVDTDGYVDKDGDIEFCNTNKQLAEDAMRLAATLGARTSWGEKRVKLYGRDCGPVYKVRILSDLPICNLPRKRIRERQRTERGKWWQVKSVTPVESEPVKCIQVAAEDGMFLAGNALIPTHNSHLLRVAFITWAIEIPGLQLYLFRRKYRDLIQGHMEGPTGFKAMLADAQRAGFVEIVKTEIRFKNGPNNDFVGGSRISLNHCFHIDDVFDYKTIEFHVLGLEETTEFDPFQIQFLRGRVRMPDTIKIPDKYLMPKKFWRDPVTPRYSFPRCLYPTNPGGPAHQFIKENFIDEHQPFELWNASKEQGGALRQFIPGLLTDNPSVNPGEYEMQLSGLPPAYRDALLHGLWDVAIGAFFPEWNALRHVVPNFTPPDHWFRYRSFDWGNAEPFAVYWIAVSDGEPFIDREQRQRWFPRGALVFYQEWYGCNADEPAKGIRMRNEDIARGIIGRSEINHQQVITLSDSKPFQSVDGTGMIANTFLKNGVPLHLGDCARVAGWSQMRGRLVGAKPENAELNEHGEFVKIPMIYFTENCRYAQVYIPMLQHHPSPAKPEDAQEHGEATHSPDAIRVGCMVHSVIKDRPEPMNTRVEKELAAKRPTINRMLAARGMKSLR